MVTIQNSPRRIADAELQSIEKALKLELPADYREFMLSHNGGEPEPRWFAFPPLSEDHELGGFDRIQFFYSVVLPPPDDFEIRNFKATVEHFRSECELPKKYAPIALTMENVVVLACAGTERGRVFYWSDIESGFEISFLVPLADSFGAFLNSLGYPASAPWMEMIDRGDVDALRQWLESGGLAKEDDEQTGFSPWSYADFACQSEAFELLSQWKGR
jgi:hypothetical protein